MREKQRKAKGARWTSKTGWSDSVKVHHSSEKQKRTEVSLVSDLQ